MMRRGHFLVGGWALIFGFLGWPLGAVEPTKLVMQLDLGVQNAQFAGLSVAQAHGWFAAAGIDLEVRRLPAGYGDLAGNVGASDHTIGSIESGLFLSGRAAGHPVVAIGTMFQASPLCLISKAQAGIREPRDLVGRHVAVHGDGHEALATILAQAGIDPATVKVSEAAYGNDPLLRGEMDVKQGYYVDEFVKLQVEGHAVTALPLKDFGHVAYSQVMFVSEATLAKHRDALVRFIKVLDRGWRAAQADQSAAVDLILATLEPQLDREYQTRSLALILDELVWAEDVRTGAMSEATLLTNVSTFLRSHPSEKLPPMDRWVDFEVVSEAWGQVR
jgi:NitT/TauT family transport system substrate-binding protein